MKTNKTYFLFLLVICLILTACRTNRQVVKSTESTTNQVTESRVTYRDTVLFTPKTETSITLPLASVFKCPDTSINKGLNSVLKPLKHQTWTQKNGNAKATVKVVHDSLFFVAECDSLALVAKIKNEYYNRYLQDVKINDEYVEKETKLNWYAIVTFIIIAFIAGFVTNSLIKITI